MPRQKVLGSAKSFETELGDTLTVAAYHHRVAHTQTNSACQCRQGPCDIETKGSSKGGPILLLTLKPAVEATTRYDVVENIHFTCITSASDLFGTCRSCAKQHGSSSTATTLPWCLPAPVHHRLRRFQQPCEHLGGARTQNATLYISAVCVCVSECV